MRSLTPRRLRTLGVLLAALLPASLVGTAARADAPAVPDFTDGFGLTEVADATEVRSATDFTITVTTPRCPARTRSASSFPVDTPPNRTSGGPSRTSCTEAAAT